MQRNGETWPGSELTERFDLDTLKRTLAEVRSWWEGEKGKEAVEVFTTPIRHYKFFIQFKDMTLSSYSFDTWTELEGTLYDNYITVSREAGYAGEEYSFYILKHDNVTVGYAAKGNDPNDTDARAHLASRFEIKVSLSENVFDVV